MTETKKCSPKCRKFRCGKKAIQFRGKNVWCIWSEEYCNPTNCNYAICLTRRLLTNGFCGEKIKRKTSEKKPEDELVQSIKVRGKTFRKIGEKEIF